MSAKRFLLKFMLSDLCVSFVSFALKKKLVDANCLLVIAVNLRNNLICKRFNH